MKKKRKILLVLIVLMIVIIIVILVLLKKSNKAGTNVNKSSNFVGVYDEEEYNDLIQEEDKTIKYVDETRNYFTVKALMNNYIDYIVYGNVNQLMNITSKEYIKQKKLTSNNILSNLDNIQDMNKNTKYINYYIDNIMQGEQNNEFIVFIINGKYKTSTSSKYRNINNIVVLDSLNQTYEIYPESYLKENKYNNINIGDKVDFKFTSIMKNEDNIFKYIDKNDKEIANIIFDNWNDLLLFDQKSAYSKLNNQYKEKRFSNYNSFTDYLSNKKYIPTINQYRVYSKDDYTDYICTDQYNNYYIFRVQGGVMRYTVFLDNYTVELGTFKENYDEADENDKVAIQTGKFKQMVNLKDYNAIYSKLNEKFKDNNFKTVSDLKKYLDEKIYNINTIEIQEITQKDDYYVCNGVIRNQQNQNEQKSIVIAIKLIGSNEFELSFSIK